ncbi:hypothetical protein PI126_g24652 [Phytophthora idaei]|nr:hypothetical protein PI126_g24652 [Phytophthora idaei]
MSSVCSALLCRCVFYVLVSHALCQTPSEEKKPTAGKNNTGGTY